MAQSPANRLSQARMLAASSRYDESLAIYAEAFSREPTNRSLFMEILKVKELLIEIKSTTQLMQMQRDAAIAQARRYIDILLSDARYNDPLRIERFGLKVYSQNEEDGIIAEIFRRIGVANRTFFE